MDSFNHKDIDNMGKIIVNAMLLALLWAILALPASSASLLRFEDGYEVLGAQNTREEPGFFVGEDYYVIYDDE